MIRQWPVIELLSDLESNGDEHIRAMCFANEDTSWHYIHNAAHDIVKIPIHELTYIQFQQIYSISLTGEMINSAWW